MEIEKILEVAELPKILVEGAQSFLNRLLGPTIDETGQLLADKVRFRRIRNQIKIADLAKKLVSDAGLTPKQVSLQTLLPLVDKASLEEDHTVQRMWSTLLANAATANARDGLHRLCVEVLTSISPKEALIFLEIHNKYQVKLSEDLAQSKDEKFYRSKFYADSIYFKPKELYKCAGIVNEIDGVFLIDNLLRLNILKWEVPEIDDGQTVHPSFVHLTELGLAVIKECIEGPTKPES